MWNLGQYRENLIFDFSILFWIGRCVRVCVCECTFVLMLGWGGRDLGWVCCFSCQCCVWVGVGICLEKCPVTWDVLFLLYMLSLLHSIIGAFGSMVGKLFGLGLCSSCPISASLFGIMLHQFLPLQGTYFRALPHSLEYIFQYIFLSLMILNIMQHDDDCNRVLEVRRGLVVIHCPFSPHQSQGQGNKNTWAVLLWKREKFDILSITA